MARYLWCCVPILVKLIDKSVGHTPLALNILAVEHAGELILIALFDLRVQAEVVLHGDMQVQDIMLPALLGGGNPLFVKPVLRPFRVAVEPELGPAD